MAADHSNAIAMIYAEAMFALAEEQQQTEKLCAELNVIAQAIEANPDFAVFLESPAINRDRKAASISRIFQGKVSQLMIDSLKVIAAKDRLNLLVEIQQCFEELDDRKAGRVKGSITTAVELPPKEQSRLTEQINRAIRKTVSLTSIVDPSIIGGMVLTIEDTVMDVSVKGALQQLTQKLRLQAAEKLPRGRDLIVQ